MALLSFEQIKQVWIDGGGSPQAADQAAKIAIAASGGDTSYTKLNPDGTIDRGLWAINSAHGKQSSVDPTENARAAVALSKSGTDWDLWDYLKGAVDFILPGDQFGGDNATIKGSSVIGDLLGIDNIPKFFYHGLLLFAGIAWIIIGFVLLLLGSRAFKTAARFTGEVVGTGVGFGVGARVAGGVEEAIFGRPAGAPGPATPPVQPAPAGPSQPALPPTSAGGLDDTLGLPRRIGPPGSPAVPKRAYRVTLQPKGGPFPKRNRRSPLDPSRQFGDYIGVHRAGDD